MYEDGLQPANSEVESISEPIRYNDNASLTQWQLEPGDIISEIENYMLGKVWSPKKEKWVVAHKPLISEDGVKDLMLYLRLHLNKLVILSNFTDEEVRRIAIESRFFMAQFIYLNYTIYGIEKRNWDNIFFTVDHAIFSILRRAYNEGERRFLGKSEKRIERTVERQAPGRSRSIFNVFKST